MISINSGMEEKIHIVTNDNRVFSYGYTPGADLQPLVNFFKKTERLSINEIYIQKVPNAPMTVVTSLYDITYGG